MTTRYGFRCHAASLLTGMILCTVTFALMGATSPDDTDGVVSPKVMPLRFLVLEATPKQNPTNPDLSVVQLRVSPHYGKLDQRSLEFRMENETQELTLLVLGLESGERIRRGDIVSFREFTHTTFSSGSQTIRHLPSGGTELVP